MDLSTSRDCINEVRSLSVRLSERSPWVDDIVGLKTVAVCRSGFRGSQVTDRGGGKRSEGGGRPRTPRDHRSQMTEHGERWPRPQLWYVTKSDGNTIAIARHLLDR